MNYELGIRNKLSHKKETLSILVILISIAVSFATCYFSVPTVFGGRDQGAIATAAIQFSESGEGEHGRSSFTFYHVVGDELFKKYGPGRALNFPGFDYQKDGALLSRFPLGYTFYLATLYRSFGLKGIQYANLIPLFLFFVLFWLTLRHFFSEKISFTGLLLAATFFPFLWFAKYTLTEIFTLFLIWSGIYFFISFRRRTSKALDVGRLKMSLAFFALSSLTRIEGIVFFLLTVAYILLLNRKKIIALPKNFHKYLAIATIFILALSAYSSFPALSDSAKNFAKAFFAASAKDSVPSVSLYARLITLFFNYGFLVYVILGLGGIAYLAKTIRKNWSRPEFLVVAVLFPSFFYLVSPLVSLDDPWVFRRFVFAVFPVLIFYSIYFLDRFFRNKSLIHVILIIMILANTAISSRFFTVSENKDLLPQIAKISQKFGPRDLILVDRLASGGGFSLISEPLTALYGKNAVYFFNADDVRFINKNKYQNIYLVAPLNEHNTWYENLPKELTDTIIIKNNFLTASSGFFTLAENTKIETTNGLWQIK